MADRVDLDLTDCAKSLGISRMSCEDGVFTIVHKDGPFSFGFSTAVYDLDLGKSCENLERSVHEAINPDIIDAVLGIIKQENNWNLVTSHALTLEDESQELSQQEAVGKQDRRNGFRSISAADEERDELLNTKLTEEQITFAFNVMYKEAKYDKIQIKHVNCGYLSTFTKIPMPQNINSLHSGAGKSYLLNTVAGYYPKKYIIILNAASNKSFHHRPGRMVIKNEETGEMEDVVPKLDALEDEISDLEYGLQKATKEGNNVTIKDIKKQIREKHHEMKDMEQKQKKLIDLSNKIIIIQDTPQESLFDNLMSLMSQDSNNDEQEYNFADTSGRSTITRANILRGMPVLFTTRVIDDSDNARFEEKTRRFINITPNVSSEKIREANRIKSINLGSIPSEYDQFVVSGSDKEEARRIISIIIEKLIDHTKYLGPKQSGTYVIFKESITDAIPSDDVWAMTVQDRLLRYLSIITKMHMDHRPRLVDKNTGAFYPISTFEDLKETLELMEMGASNVRAYLAAAYNQVFLPAFKETKGKGVTKLERQRDDGSSYVIAEETHAGCTTEELAEAIHKELGIPTPSIKELRVKYLYPLSNQGLINYARSTLNGKENIWYAVDESQNVFSLFANDDKEFKLKVKNPALCPTTDVLEECIGSLSRRNVEGDHLKNNYEKCVLDDYELLDVNGEEISTHELIENYFQHPEICFANVPTPRLVFTKNHKKDTEMHARKEKVKTTINDEPESVYGCYACREFELANDKEAYKKHCIETHPNCKLTTRVIPERSFGNGEAKLIRLPCPFCEFIDVTPIKMEDHIENTHADWICSK